MSLEGPVRDWGCIMGETEKDKAIIEMDFIVFRPNGTISEEETGWFIKDFYAFLATKGLTSSGGLKLKPINLGGYKENGDIEPLSHSGLDKLT